MLSLLICHLVYISKDLLDLVKSIVESRSKQEEDRITSNEAGVEEWKSLFLGSSAFSPSIGISMVSIVESEFDLGVSDLFPCKLDQLLSLG